MKTKELIERVASGLRKMDRKPDYLLFSSEFSEDIFWDLPSICNIPVLRCGYIAYSAAMSMANNPFIPIWKDENTKNNASSVYFNKGFEDNI